MKRYWVSVLNISLLSSALLTTTALAPVSVFADSPGAIRSNPQVSTSIENAVPAFRNVSVHDPSVIKVGDTFYIFGSHLQVAKSKDLMNWDSVASGVTDDNPVVPNVTKEFAEALQWAQTDTLWAADVIQLADGKFYMYYNACKGDSPRSALGVAVADNIEGPYKDQGILLKSGMWDEISEDGTIYDATIHPNVVDPDVFFDKNGKLWMVYGSYSGGIFILEMDETTGKPLPNQGYGKKLTGGNHSRIEAPYMLYNPETDYYYLYLSYGGLGADGGYNIRVARSKTPDGPFLDAEGNDMINVKADKDKPLFDDRSIEPFGVKLLGNFLFQRQIGDPGTGQGIGYVSPGHNSAYVDAETGKQFLIFHSRFPGRGEEHEVRVHEMHMNSEGWPVVSPYRYAGLEEDTAALKTQDIAGQYKWVNHGKEITAEIKSSQTVQFTADGQISGAVTGTWSLKEDNQVQITSNNVLYKGVFTHEWEPYSQKTVLTFSALSSSGVAIWGSQMAAMKDQDIVNAVKKDLSIGDTGNVFFNLSLPIKGTRDTEITWKSSNTSALSATGVVNRPRTGKGDAKVALTATIRKGSAVSSKTFNVIIPQQAVSPLLGEYTFEQKKLAKIAQDFSKNKYHGQAFNVVTSAISSKNQAAAFNGTDSYIQLPGIITDTNDFTFSAWVNWSGGGAWQRIFDFGNGLTRHMFLTPAQHNGAMQFTIHDQGRDQSLIAAEPLPSNQWVHVAVTLQENTGTLYVNGKAVASSTEITFNPKDLQVTEAYLGKSRYTADPFYKGSMDNVKVYDKALTSTEIQRQAKEKP
ncbi:arabinan endo-1,5-alpha-L-arabinosidase [Paenibacillus sp. ov031]|uniref:family 43 glycosylhydrolase n=1 Tax=unclassified Paenibacillus TaxID=185978 RepID=UPI00089D1D5E|nr:MULTISPECIES: family 43 glycosylhydrolase [unclassified Paenibacillus]SEA44105.1 arabinan endo-1,5-alpha-L-arabinosidase [Paenibacillus sp. 276b]SHN56082.1 arabinan endo-1,5-alpha-L-arabinosidase [Paenibacillus sp. ov031]